MTEVVIGRPVGGDVVEDTVEIRTPNTELAVVPKHSVVLDAELHPTGGTSFFSYHGLIDIHGRDHRLETDIDFLEEAVAYPHPDEGNFFWRVPIQRFPINAVRIEPGGNRPFWLKRLYQDRGFGITPEDDTTTADGEDSDETIYDAKRKEMVIKIPPEASTTVAENEAPSAMKDFLNLQFKRGLLQHIAANVIYRRWGLYAPIAFLTAATSGGTAAGMSLEELTALDRMKWGAIVWAGTLAIGGAVSYVKTRAAMINKGASRWSHKREKRHDYSLLNEKAKSDDIFEIVPDEDVEIVG